VAGGSLTDRLRRELARDASDTQSALEYLARRLDEDDVLRDKAGTPLEVMLGPVLLDRRDHSTLCSDVGLLVETVLEVGERLYEGDPHKMCRGLALSKLESELVSATWLDGGPVPLRTDLYETTAGWKAIEINVTSSLGGQTVGDLNRAVASVPMLRRVVSEAGLRYEDPLKAFVDALWSALRSRDAPTRPRVAIVDSPEYFGDYELQFRAIARSMRSSGLDAFTCTAQDLRVRSGRLYFGSIPIDAVYRMFLLEDLATRPRDADAILEAYLAGRLLLVVSFYAEALGAKSLFVALREGAARGAFAPDREAVIRSYVPETAFVEPAEMEWNGQRVECRELLLDGRERLVIKRVVSHSTRGVAIGDSTPPDTWRQIVEGALRRPRTHIVQERLFPLGRPIFDLTRNGVTWRDFSLQWSVFGVGASPAGYIVRANPAPVPDLMIGARGSRLACVFHE
jgi:hypothetical protein